jgi:hypothetical protein
MCYPKRKRIPWCFQRHNEGRFWPIGGTVRKVQVPPTRVSHFLLFIILYIYSNIKPSLIWPNNDEKTIVKTRKDYWRSFHWAFCFYLFNIYLNIKLPLSWTYSDKKKTFWKYKKNSFTPVLNILLLITFWSFYCVFKMKKIYLYPSNLVMTNGIVKRPQCF